MLTGKFNLSTFAPIEAIAAIEKQYRVAVRLCPRLQIVPAKQSFLLVVCGLRAESDQAGALAVETVAPVTLPYTPQMGLTAVYTQTPPALQCYVRRSEIVMGR